MSLKCLVVVLSPLCVCVCVCLLSLFLLFLVVVVVGFLGGG